MYGLCCVLFSVWSVWLLSCPMLIWDEGVVAKFSLLAVSVGVIKGVSVERGGLVCEKLRDIVFGRVRSMFDLEELKDNSVVRAYRDLFWALGVDPTKTRPSGEALLRRALHGQDIPRISSAVDAYNLASMETIVPISGFDLDAVVPPLSVRFSRRGDVFQGIGMRTPEPLDDNLLIVTDKRQILSIYPHKDADATKITGKTENILLVGYGTLNVSIERLVGAVNLALSYIKETSGGKIGEVRVSSAGA